MATEWKVVGASRSNDGVANLLNSDGIGRSAAVSINAAKSEFVVWGDDDDATIIPGNVWSTLGTTPSNSEANDLLQDYGAAGGAVSVNNKGVWVVWGYIDS